jgi:hypothetical protein
MARLDEYAADRRAALSRARLPAKWRSWMDQWSLFRGQAWKIDREWTAPRLFVHSERLKGPGEWVPLSDTASTEIILIDQCVADLVGCVIAHEASDRDSWTPEKWARLRHQLWHGEFYLEDDELDQFNDQLEEDQRWEEKFRAAREREGDLLLMHYLLPHVRLYGKLRALQLSERAYYYRLDSALQTLDDEYVFRAEHLNNVQS